MKRSENFTYNSSNISQKKALKAVALGIAATMGFMFDGYFVANAADADKFITDSKLGGNVYFWSRDRDRKKIATDKYNDKYESNLKHSTINAELNFQSGYAYDVIGIELGGYVSVEFNNGGPAYPNEIGFSDANKRWDEKWTGDKSGVSYYKAQINLKKNNYWAKMGYLQPSGQTLLRPHWSFLPGTYEGVEVGAEYDFGKAGDLAFSYMWTDRYKAPWYINIDYFREKNAGKRIDYLHSIGAKYDFKNNLVLEAAFGQSKNYLNQYFAKVSYELPVFNNPLKMSYQFYGSKDQNHDSAQVYDGLAWLQGITLQYKTGPLDWRLEGTVVKAKGQGYFLQRMTPDWASSNGRLDIWWDGRSDFNADGERSIYAGVSYDMAAINLPGWRVGASYIYAWNAKPGSFQPDANMSRKIKESAWNLDLSYKVQKGRFKDTLFTLHYTNYNNHSNIPSWTEGFANIFQDERDIKFMIIMPFKIR